MPNTRRSRATSASTSKYGGIHGRSVVDASSSPSSPVSIPYYDEKEAFSYPESLGGGPERSAIPAVGLDSPRGIGDSAERGEFLGGLPEGAAHDEGVRLAVLLLFEPVEP